MHIEFEEEILESGLQEKVDNLADFFVSVGVDETSAAFLADLAHEGDFLEDHISKNNLLIRKIIYWDIAYSYAKKDRPEILERIIRAYNSGEISRGSPSENDLDYNRAVLTQVFNLLKRETFATFRNPKS